MKSTNTRGFPPRLGTAKPMITVVLALSCVTCCSVLVILAINTRISIVVNEWRWMISKPASYYIEVKETQVGSGYWHWAIKAEDGTVKTSLLDSNTFGISNSQSLFSERADMEHMFELASACLAREWLACVVEYDPDFHYPRRIDSNDLFVIEVVRFIPCTRENKNCGPS